MITYFAFYNHVLSDSMLQCVTFEMIGPKCRVVAVITLVTANALAKTIPEQAMRRIMSIEADFGCGGIIADVTFVRLLPCMFSHVNNQFLFVS